MRSERGAPALAVNRLTKRFGDRVAFQDISFEVGARVADTQALVYMLAILAIVPAVVAAYSVAGERQQDTLEPVLTTPVRAEELLGKGLAALAPSLVVAYGDLPLEVRQAVRLMRRPSGSAGQEVHAEPGPADQHPDTA
ncbi:MAG TPA: hypothetical protein VFJ69_00890 [Actinomycetota bacterium]|nr:hypothetical protein [Actinomycetota bacterium]